MSADPAVALAIHHVALVQVHVEHAKHLTLVDAFFGADVLLDYDLWVLGILVDRLAAAEVGRALLLVQHDILQLLRVDCLIKMLMSVMIIYALSNSICMGLFGRSGSVQGRPHGVKIRRFGLFTSDVMHTVKLDIVELLAPNF